MPVIRGTVVDSAGRPVAGARILVVQSPGPMPDIAMLSGEDGSFAIGAPAAGRYLLEAATDSSSARADVDPGPQETALTIRLPQ